MSRGAHTTLGVARPSRQGEVAAAVEQTAIHEQPQRIVYGSHPRMFVAGDTDGCFHPASPYIAKDATDHSIALHKSVRGTRSGLRDGFQDPTVIAIHG